MPGALWTDPRWLVSGSTQESRRKGNLASPLLRVFSQPAADAIPITPDAAQASGLVSTMSSSVWEASRLSPDSASSVLSLQIQLDNSRPPMATASPPEV